MSACVECRRTPATRLQGRGLCSTCYRRHARAGTLARFEGRCDVSMRVDHAVVARAVRWVGEWYAQPWSQRPQFRGRPRLSRGEKVAALAALQGVMPGWAAARALGISGKLAPAYLEAATR